MKVFTLKKDYPLAGKRKGETIKASTLSASLKSFVEDEEGEEVETVEKPAAVLKAYTLKADYPLAGKKKGETIRVSTLSTDLKNIVEEVADENDDVETPNIKWRNEDIIVWLANHNVEAKGTKEELLKEVKKVLKSK